MEETFAISVTRRLSTMIKNINVNRFLDLKNENITFKFVFIIYFFLFVFLGPSYTYGQILYPDFEKRDEEKLVLEKIYVLPMNAISDILEDGLKHCNRLPDENEFRDFVVKGPSPTIRCSQGINLKPDIPRTEHKFGNSSLTKPDIDVQGFLKKQLLEIYSDTKTLYVILKQDPKKWTFTYFKAQDYDLLIHCADRKCHRTTLDIWKRSCRNNPSFAKHNCYLGDKKVIDYD